MKFIGVKLVEAIPATHGEYSLKKYGESTNSEFSQQNKDTEGYEVTYDDGYVSWCPKAVFEKHNFQIENENKITEKDVKNFIADVKIEKCDCDDEKCDKKEVVIMLKNGVMVKKTLSGLMSSILPSEVAMEYILSIAQVHIGEKLAFLLDTANQGVNLKKEAKMTEEEKEKFEADVKETMEQYDEVLSSPEMNDDHEPTIPDKE